MASPPASSSHEPLLHPDRDTLARQLPAGSPDPDLDRPHPLRHLHGPTGHLPFPITLTAALLAHATGPHPELMVWPLTAPVLVLLAVVD
ncbi:hypothetical protein [Streptomyces sp. NPDC057426]|uniref:hypothetical protein n=1 Tax=Streptomyces sp. NPDC057426 TaxID=3346128 RepID=UPI0036973F1E